MKINSTKTFLSIFCLMNAVLVFKYSYDLEGTEFSSGYLTRILLLLNGAGGLLFVFTSILIFLRYKFVKIIVFFAIAACLPLYVYFIMPDAFQYFSEGENSVKLSVVPTENIRAMFGILLLSITAIIFLIKPVLKISPVVGG